MDNTRYDRLYVLDSCKLGVCNLNLGALKRLLCTVLLAASRVNTDLDIPMFANDFKITCDA